MWAQAFDMLKSANRSPEGPISLGFFPIFHPHSLVISDSCKRLAVYSFHYILLNETIRNVDRIFYPVINIIFWEQCMLPTQAKIGLTGVSDWAFVNNCDVVDMLTRHFGSPESRNPSPYHKNVALIHLDNLFRI